MPITVSHALSATTPDDPAYEIRPSHWNSNHVATINAVGSEIIGAFSNDPAVNVSFSTNGGGFVIASANVTAAPSPVNVTGDNGSSVNAQTIAFKNSNGLTLGVSTAANGASITGSYTVPSTAGLISRINVSGGTTSNNLSALTFADGNGVSFGLNGSTLTASHNALTSQSNQAFSAQGGSSAFQTLSFNNANGMTFSNVGGAVQGSYTVPSTAGLISAINVSGGTTSNDLSKITFSDANGVSFGLNGSVMTASVAAAGGAQTGISGIIVSDATYTSGTVSFSNQNGVTIGSSVNGASQYIRLSVANQSAQTQSNVQGIIVSNTTYRTGDVSFSNLNGISFGSNGANVVTASYTVPTQTNQTGGIYNSSQTTGASSSSTYDVRSITHVFSGNISGGWTNGSLLFNVTTAAQTNQTLGIYASSNTTGASSSSTHDARSLTIVGSDNISVGWTNGSLAIKGAAGGGVTPVASASNGSFSFTTINFSNANNVTFGTSAGSIITASVAAPGAAAENNAINLLGANTAGNTTATGSTIGWSGINVTLSGTNNSVVNISAPATSSLVGTSGISISTNGSTISIMAARATYPGIHPYDDFVQAVGQIGQASLIIDPQPLPNFNFDRVGFLVQNTNSSNSSGSHTLSFWVGLYTRNASTLSRVYSMSGSTALTHSGTAGSYSLYSGKRLLALTVAATTIEESRYWIGFVSRTTSGGTNGSYSNYMVSNLNSNFTGMFGSAANATAQPKLGQGYYSATTSGMPASIAFSEIQGTASLAMRMPTIGFGSGTA